MGVGLEARGRKRAAMRAMWSIATALHVAFTKKQDATIGEAERLHADLLLASPSEEQVAEVESALKRFKGEDTDVDMDGQASSDSSEFRIRGKSCLFTYNSPGFNTRARGRITL